MITVRIGDNECYFSGELEMYFEPFRKHIIGNGQGITTPYGKKRIVYADWTASGRLYRPVENQVSEVFGPFMANTHTESNSTSSIMTLAYKQAQRIIKNHVNADEDDVLIASGSGMTDVVNKLQRILGLKVPEKFISKINIPESERPVIFVTHMEHHSNHTSWFETIGDVEVITPGTDGKLDLNQLEQLLNCYAGRTMKIGSFTACSNVTGIQTPYHQLARKMHEHGGICFIDFAASAPYMDIDMHPKDPIEKLDGIFFSPHKFLGGPGANGVLLFDSRLYTSKVPDHPGGGTVTWTNPWGKHQYFENIEIREDGGTPGILQTIKTALCIKLKEQMGTENILKREKELMDLLLPGLESISGIHILDGKITDRLGIVSFFSDDIHYNLIVKLLNDRFGYQVRGGCSCAGTYGHYLLKIDEKTSNSISDKINQGDMSTKPGWVRISVHPTMTNEEVYGFVKSLKLIIENIKEWEKEYLYDPKSNDYFYIHQERDQSEELFRLQGP
ncbi:aminotransferase class V-fold PLP-dependent enzyme [Peribacillus cavernae]|uniref:Aminotransferase class V-fold PLP-dependent enzyme n=1 Tax=Peribacillus cavernae TaxID=1674310 RepID=A0A3S0UC89_9BACI|nr:aminotransferase class V-fold PLP-dependent enzyme [Peribacillus cavernae]MDQ0217698.1 selenocysteine lyase/cysteine desulfurase [Peribacillus cavernae]RUQ28168.1 aminotransferase class V-fold PLP-dependent enzyme [Peribacillus cavernae]